MMSVIVQNDEGFYVYTKGAPDVLMEKASGILIGDIVDQSEQSKDNFIKVVDDYADEALRTLAVAYKKLMKKRHYTEPRKT